MVSGSFAFLAMPFAFFVLPSWQAAPKGSSPTSDDENHRGIFTPQGFHPTAQGKRSAALGGATHSQNPTGFHKMRTSQVIAMYGMEMNPDVVFVEPFQGTRSILIPTQGGAALALGCWIQPLRGKDRRSPETRRRAAEPGGGMRTRARSDRPRRFSGRCSRGRQELSERRR